MVECMRTAAKLPERNKRKMEEENTNEKQTEHIYISGPITGTKDYMQRFEKAEKELTEKGYSVINPAKVNAMLPQDATWEEYIRVSLTLLSICTGVYMMPGWRESRGAVLEFMQARRNGMQIYEDIPGRLQN
jgi:hypothetical protein